MFNSSVLDVALGVVFAFLALSLVTSALVEAINSFFALRANTLLAGIKDLVNDPAFTDLARALYKHAAINPRGSPGRPLIDKPSYIDKLQFANGLMDVVGLSGTTAAPGPAAVAALKDSLAAFVVPVPGGGGRPLDPQIAQLLQGMIERAQGDIALLRQDIAGWFDAAMDRVGGAFKRRTQAYSFGIALLLAAGLNVDAIHLATTLWKQPSLVSQLRVPAAVVQAAIQHPNGEPAATPEEIRTAAAGVIGFLDQSLPVGWPPGHIMMVYEKGELIGIWQATDWPTRMLGWVITAFATLFGAPFWFDVLQGVVRLKGSGPSPAEKLSGRAAAT